MEYSVLHELGYLTLGTRLKRIGDALQGGVTEAFLKRGIRVQAGQVPLLLALSADQMTVSDLAARLGVRQPGVSRAIGQLSRQGYVAMATGREDRRVRSVRLTTAGHELIAHVQATMFAGVEAAAKQLCAGLQGSFLQELTELDDRLAEKPFARRIEGEIHAARA